MTRRCTSSFSVVWMLVALAGCGVAVAQDVSGAMLPPGGDLGSFAWFLDRYGTWGAVLVLGWRALGVIDRVLTKGIDAGQAALETFSKTGKVLAEHLERLLKAAEAGKLKVVVDHQHTGAAPLSIEATVGVGE